MTTFEDFFNSEVKSRLIKFFLYNGTKFFSVSEIGQRLAISGRSVRGPLIQLLECGFVRSKSATQFAINPKFPHLSDLKNMVLQFPAVSDETLTEEVHKIGSIKLFIIAGVLINSPKARAEALIVGNKISEKKSARFLAMIEASIGREVRYVLMTPDEFKYRKNMFDRFVLDILEFPHRTIINKLKI